MEHKSRKNIGKQGWHIHLLAEEIAG